MKCPKCQNDMEKASDSDTMLCRKCGHTESGLTKAEMASKILAMEKKWEEREKREKERQESGGGDW